MKSIFLNKVSKILVIVVVIIVLSGNIIATSINDMRDSLNDIQEQIKQNKNQISNVEKEVQNRLNEIQGIESDISKYSDELEKLQKKIDDVNTKVSTLETSLQNASQTYDSAQEMYVTRLRIIYEHGMPSLLDILFESKGISDFFSKVNVLNSILDYDRKLVNNMQSQKEYVDYVKKDIESQKLQLDQLKYDKEKSAQALMSSKSAKETKVSQLSQSKVNLLAATSLLLEEQKKTEAKLQEELRKSNYNAIFGGIFQWPVGSTRINAGFGYYNPYGTGYIPHYGVDVGGLGYTSEVKAAARGKVTTARVVTTNPDGPTPNKYSYGYGNYVIVNHGRSSDGNVYITIYGHLSSVSVKEGDIIEQGTKLGVSGNTGNSTGPHLHFEIRKNGTAINPSNFFGFLR